MNRLSYCIVVIASFGSIFLMSSCKTRKSSLEGSGGPRCNDCCSLDPEAKEKEGTPYALREAASLRIHLMKAGIEQGDPLAMIILAKLIRKQMTGESITTEQYLSLINTELGGKLLSGSGSVDEQINEEVLKQVADKFRDGILQGNAAIPGDKKLNANSANIQEMLTEGLKKVADAGARQILVSEIQDAMSAYFEASGTESFGQKSALKPAQAMVMVDILVDSVVGAKMDYVGSEGGAARSRLPFQKEIDLQVGKSYADAIYAKIARMSYATKISPAELGATESMLKTYREAVKDRSQMAEVEAALEVLKRADNAGISALREGKVTVNGKVAEVRFKEGFSRDVFLKAVESKGLEGRVRDSFREADGKRSRH